jgi:hypothetical protein
MRRTLATLVITAIALTGIGVSAPSATAATDKQIMALYHTVGFKIYKYTNSIDRTLICSAYTTGREEGQIKAMIGLVKKVAKIKKYKAKYTEAEYRKISVDILNIICSDSAMARDSVANDY